MKHLFTFLCNVAIVQIATAIAITLPFEKRTEFPELVAKYGYKTEEYEVVTEDGYFLSLFRIRGESKRPILLMHGILDSSDTWILRGNTSLAITLVRKGYDVWVGNCRGNRYGRRHKHYDPNLVDGFWDYSFHEHGYYDLPAIIDNVLYNTGAEKLDAIGHSQGTTIFYVLGSTRPEYNDKVNVLVALAPICFFYNIPPPLKTIIEYSPSIYGMAKSIGVQEVLGLGGQQNPLKPFCHQPLVGYTMCITNAVFPITGDDEEELEADIVPVLFEHFPMATSLHNLYHYAQVNFRKQFARFDYGSEINLSKYGSPVPSTYDVSKVTMKVALLVGGNDKISTLEDAAILNQTLPNVVRHLVIPHRKMNHADFIWGLHMQRYLFPYIFQVLDQFSER